MESSFFSRSFSVICIVSLIFISSFSSLAQQKSTYNLLWEITGKGLKKPSYLFGSMHIRDQRIFNFSDSVMKAMESCSGFVLEAHPDSLTKSYYETANKTAKDRDVKKILSEEQMTELLKRFEEKNGYQPDSTMLNNPALISSLMKPDYSKDDDMQTFMDAYLYGIARTLKKKIFGLEKVEDQINTLYDTDEKITEMFDNDEDAQQEYMEEMINLYVKGNIDDMWRFLSLSTDEVDDRLNLKARNKVMAEGMISLFANDNIFTTVGTAHLPGENGIIALLRKAGYKLRPVEATFTGISKKYTIDYAKMDWQSYQDPINNYSVDFPAMPVRATTKQSITNMVYYSDIVNESIYHIGSYFTGPIVKSEAAKYLNTFFETYTADKQIEILGKKEIEKDGVIALEAEFKTKGRFVRTLLCLQNNTFYSLTLENKKNVLYDAVANRFFSSFRSTKPAVIEANKWVLHKNVAGAFSVKLPVQPEEMIKEVPNSQYSTEPFHIYLYMAADQVNMFNYLVRYNDYPKGMYLADLPAALATVTKQFESKGKIIGEPRVIFKDGYEGREVDVVLQDSYLEFKLFMRGNRTYLLLRQNLKEAVKTTGDDFFDSFKFEKYSPSPTVPFTIGNLKLTLPSEPALMNADEEKEDEESSFLKDGKSYYAINEKSGGVYGIQSATLSKYVKYQTVDSLYKFLINALKAETDSLRKLDDFLIGNIKGKVYTAKDTLGGTEKMAKMWVDRNKFYYQSAVVSKEEIDSKELNNFFNNLNYTPVQSTFNLQLSKAQLIMDDLRSKDTTVYKAAYGALDYYEFEKAELPIIYKTLRLPFADDSLRLGVRTKLISKLKPIHDASTIPFLKELYKAKNPDHIQSIILTAVPQIDSTHYDWYLKNLIETPQLKLDNYWILFNPLSDSLAYTAKNFVQLLPLFDREEYRRHMLYLVGDMLDEDHKSTYLDLITLHQAKITAKAITDVDKYIADQELPATNVNAYLSVLSNLNMPKLTDEFTNKVFKLDSATYLHTSALAVRIKANLSLDQNMLSAQLDSLSSRYEIMSAYNQVGRLNEVPLKYRKHDEFAKLLVYNYMESEDEYPSEINLLGKVSTALGTYYTFEMLFDVDGEEKRYIAITGAFNDKKADLEFDKYEIIMDWEEVQEDWQAQAKKIIADIEEVKN